MQAAIMQQSGGVYLGNSVPKLSQHQSSPSASSSASGGVKKWKNKLKTFLNSPLPGQSSSSQSTSLSNHNGLSAVTSIPSPSSSTTASATPRPESPREKRTSPTTSCPTSPQHFGVADQLILSSTPKPTATRQTGDTAAASSLQNDVYAGYDISASYPSSHHHDTDSAGPNDSYEARLSRLVGDLENVDYGSFANFLGGTSGDILVNGSNSNDSTGNTGDPGQSDDIRISSALFSHASPRMSNDVDDTGIFNSKHPFAYASVGTPSHLDSNSVLSGISTKPFSNNYLSDSLNFHNSYPLSSFNANGIINTEEATDSCSTPFFTDFSAYTNLDDDLHGSSSDIRIPSFESQRSSDGESQTPSSAASLPLSTVHSADSDVSGRSTAATSEILQRTESENRWQPSQAGNTSIPVPFSVPDIASLCPQPVIKHSTSMPFAPFRSLSISAPDRSTTHLEPSYSTAGKDMNSDDENEFSSLLQQSQTEAGSASSHATIGAVTGPQASLSSFQAQSLPSTSSLSTQATSPLTVADFDLTMFPMPKSTATASVKMGSQPSSGSESSYGPSPCLSYGGSSTSNTSFDDPNVNKDSLAFAPKKSKGGKNAMSNPKNLSISLEEPEFDTSSVTISPELKTPTHSPHPSLSSFPPTPATPASYKTASSNPASPYRPRPVVHASALAWRVAPSPHSPRSAIPVDTARTIRPAVSQSFICSDPFATAPLASRLNKLNTASSPELKRRRNTADEDEVGSPVGLSGIEARLANGNDAGPVTHTGAQTMQPLGEAGSALRPIAYRRRVGHKFSTPQLALQVPPRDEQQRHLSQAAPSLHQRQHSQPLPATSHLPPSYNMPASAGPSSSFQNSQQLHTRQFTSPLPSPSAAAYNYTQQQTEQPSSYPQQTPATGSWLSDNIITSLITQLSDGSFMCLMQNCRQTYEIMDDVKAHISGHFAPQTVPLQHSQPQTQSVYQQQTQTIPQYQMYPQLEHTQYPQSQQQSWI